MNENTSNFSAAFTENSAFSADFGAVQTISGGVKSYSDLKDKPTLNGVTIEGVKTSADYKIINQGAITNDDILSLFK